MYCNDSAILHTKDNNYTLSAVFITVTKQCSTDQKRSKLSRKINLYIPQNKNSIDISSLEINQTSDYVTLASEKHKEKHMITSFSKCLYGSPYMHHAEMEMV